MYIYVLQVLLGCLADLIICSKNIIFLDLNIPTPFSYENLPGSFNVTLVNPLFTPELIAFNLIKKNQYVFDDYGFYNVENTSLHNEIVCTFETKNNAVDRDHLELVGQSIVVYGIFHFCGHGSDGFISLTNMSQFPTGVTLLLNSSTDQNTGSNFHVDTHIQNNSLLVRRSYFVDYLPMIVDRTTEWSKFKPLSQFDHKPLNKKSEFGSKTNVRQKRDVNNSHIDPVLISRRPGQQEPYVMELYLIVDETLTAEYRGDYDRLIFRVNMIMSIVNGLFAQFNIVIVVVKFEIWRQDRIRLNVEEHHLLTTLAQFKRMHANVRHDCLHALLGVKDQDSRMRGKANHMTMCVYSRCVGYSRDSPNLNVIETARTVAHEIGHNFGLRHDTEECECQGCIMATGVEFGTTIMQWSPCSLADLPGLLKYAMGACLKDLPLRGLMAMNNEESTVVPSVVSVYDSQQKVSSIRSKYLSYKDRKRNNKLGLYDSGLCGNGQLDPGETCDCGTQTSCPDEWKACCDVTTCRLKQGSACAGGPCCAVVDFNNGNNTNAHCILKPPGTVCRVESNSCDLPEYCDGQSQWCPADVYKADGEVCYTDDGNAAYCVRGGCRDSDSWCRVLWGKTAKKAHHSCFYENQVLNYGSKVDSVANCGIRRPAPSDRWEDVKSWPGIQCQKWDDAECGRLWCHHQNEKAMLLGWIQTQTRVVHSASGSCFALVYDPVWPISDPITLDHDNVRQINPNGAGYGVFSANTQDAGMVPDGTPCSRGVCYNGSCYNVDEIKSRLKCNCKGYGICNNLGHCHCFAGFKPPDCEYGGNGGSIDSGPPPPFVRDNALLVILCALLLLILPTVIGLFYWFLIKPGKCLLISPKQITYTSSGLQRPFDQGCAHLVLQCCKPSEGDPKQHNQYKTYPLFAYQSQNEEQCLEKSMQTNGRCSVETKSNHTQKNQQQQQYQPMSSKPTESVCQPSVGTVKQQHQQFRNYYPNGSNRTEQIINRINSTNASEQTTTNRPKRQNKYEYKAYNSTINSNHRDSRLYNDSVSVKSIEEKNFISNPSLQSMTYQGKTCSLQEANTLRRPTKQQSKTSNAAPYSPLQVYNTEMMDESPQRPLSPKDISTPMLQTTSYNENLIDLNTAREKMRRYKQHNYL